MSPPAQSDLGVTDSVLPFTALFAFSLFAGLIARSWGVVLASAATLAAMVLLYRFFAQSEVCSLAAYYKPIFKSYGLEEITP